jgi:hypothetical protein
MNPPRSTDSATPVIDLDRSDARNSAAYEISSGSVQGRRRSERGAGADEDDRSAFVPLT